MMHSQESPYSFLAPPGRLSVFTKQAGFVNSQPRISVAEAVARQNTPNYLLEHFFGRRTQILQLIPKGSAGDVCIMVPTSPYTEGTSMVVASDHNIPPDPDTKKLIPARKIYDYPNRLQETYWASILSSLRYYQQHSEALFPSEPNSQGGKVIAIENSMSAISSLRYRTPRSIAIPHTHIVPINYAQIQPAENNSWHLRLEQRIFRMLSHSEYPPDQQVWDLLSPEIQQLFSSKMEPHLLPPYGYAFSLPADISTANFTRLMFAHNQAYCSVNTKLLEQFSFYKKRDDDPVFYYYYREPNKQPTYMPPESYRVYIERQQDSIVVRISPAFISHAGVMESMGIELHRSPDNPRMLSEQQVDQFLDGFRISLNGKFMRD